MNARTGRHLRTGNKFVVISDADGVVTIRYTSGGVIGLTARYHAEEVGDHLVFDVYDRRFSVR